MTLPILWNHDPNDAIGMMSEDGVITFKPFRVTSDLMPFGMGYRILEQQERDGVMYLSTVQVLELSCSPITEPSPLG